MANDGDDGDDGFIQFDTKNFATRSIFFFSKRSIFSLVLYQWILIKLSVGKDLLDPHDALGGGD